VFDRLKDFFGVFQAVIGVPTACPGRVRLRNRRVNRRRSGTVNALWTREQIPLGRLVARCDVSWQSIQGWASNLLAVGFDADPVVGGSRTNREHSGRSCGRPGYGCVSALPRRAFFSSSGARARSDPGAGRHRARSAIQTVARWPQAGLFNEARTALGLFIGVWNVARFSCRFGHTLLAASADLLSELPAPKNLRSFASISSPAIEPSSLLAPNVTPAAFQNT
jgi:hypothetical protein